MARDFCVTKMNTRSQSKSKASPRDSPPAKKKARVNNTNDDPEFNLNNEPAVNPDDFTIKNDKTDADKLNEIARELFAAQGKPAKEKKGAKPKEKKAKDSAKKEKKTKEKPAKEKQPLTETTTTTTTIEHWTLMETSLLLLIVNGTEGIGTGRGAVAGTN